MHPTSAISASCLRLRMLRLDKYSDVSKQATMLACTKACHQPRPIKHLTFLSTLNTLLLRYRCSSRP